MRADERSLRSMDSRMSCSRRYARQAASWQVLAGATHQGRERARRRCHALWHALGHQAGPTAAQACRCSTLAVKGLPHDSRGKDLARSAQHKRRAHETASSCAHQGKGLKCCAEPRTKQSNRGRCVRVPGASHARAAPRQRAAPSPDVTPSQERRTQQTSVPPVAGAAAPDDANVSA